MFVTISCFDYLRLKGDEHDKDAKYAYQALMTVHLYDPSTEEYVNFQHDLRKRQQEEYNWTRPEGDDVNRDYFFHIYSNLFTQPDAIVILSLALLCTLITRIQFDLFFC